MSRDGFSIIRNDHYCILWFMYIQNNYIKISNPSKFSSSSSSKSESVKPAISITPFEADEDFFFFFDNCVVLQQIPVVLCLDTAC